MALYPANVTWITTQRLRLRWPMGGNVGSMSPDAGLPVNPPIAAGSIQDGIRELVIFLSRQSPPPRRATLSPELTVVFGTQRRIARVLGHFVPFPV